MSIKTIAKTIIRRLTSRDFRLVCIALLLRFKYRCIIYRLRGVYGKRKIVVAFCVSEISKWKSQILYDQLADTDTYYPVIFVYPSPLDFGHKDSNVDTLVEEKYRFFINKKMNVVNVWDNVSNQCVISYESRPDIIFYQQPWDTSTPFPLPLETAAYSLSFYIPYFLINNFNLKLELEQSLHRQVYGHIVQNEQIVKFYKSRLNKKYYAGKLFGLGYVALVKDFIKYLFISSCQYYQHFCCHLHHFHQC